PRFGGLTPIWLAPYFCMHSQTLILRPGVLSQLLVFAAFSVPAAARAEEKITFQDHVRPIFESACVNCHNPDKKKGGLDLTSYAAMMAGGSAGEGLASGAPPDRPRLGSVTHPAEPYMPPQGDPLNAAQLEVIRKWIEGGLL